VLGVLAKSTASKFCLQIRLFVQDAKDYLPASDFGPMPDIPQLAGAKREWEFEVAFFTPKN
jgi:hypothetical protein